MTASEFRTFLNDNYRLMEEWPEYLVVDVDTYARAVEALLLSPLFHHMGGPVVRTGLHGGPLFKGIELLLQTPTGKCN